MKNIILLVAIVLAFMACKSEVEKQIIGKWQAAQLKECEDVVPIQTELVNIEFSANGKYVFNSTLNVKEDGTYRINKNYLFTLDKLRKNAAEKAVLIKQLTADTLILEMNYKGKDQWLTLVREGASDRAAQKAEEESNKAALVAAGGAPIMAAAVNTDSIQKVEEAKKLETEKKEAEAEKADAEKKAKEADRKSESKSSTSLSYKEREAKRKEQDRKEREERERRAAQFRKDYAKREAKRREEERKKK